MLLLSQCLAPPTGRAGHTLILVAFLAPAWPIAPNLALLIISGQHSHILRGVQSDLCTVTDQVQL